MKYDSLDDFRYAKTGLRAERDRHAESIAMRWTLLKDSEVRSTLIKNTAVDVARGTAMGRQIHELLNGRFSGPLISGLGLAYASTRAGFGKRMLFSGISLALGKLMGDKEDDDRGILTKLAEGIGSIVRKVRAHRAEPGPDVVDPDPTMYAEEPFVR